MKPLARLLAAAALLTPATAHAQLWQTPQTTAAQAILKDYAAQGNVLKRGETTVTLDVAGNAVVGVFIEAGTVADLARGIGVGWGLTEAELPKLQANLAAPRVLTAAKKGVIELTDDGATDLIALKSTGDGAQTRFSAYVAVKVWPDSAFPATRNVMGSAAAPDTLRIFSDFQCPYCKQMWDRSAKAWEAAPEAYRTYHYQFPLTMHRNAFAAAEASECASAQGQFWPYANALFAAYEQWTPLEPKDIPATLTTYAKAAGLDPATFTACLSSHAFKSSIDAQIKAGIAVGVQGTPTVYLNGVKLQNYSDAAELARVHAATTATPSAAALIDARLKLFR
ncbi:DsbA family protein [Deinococcus sp. KSM4-11]|uniref:DsbA family protein n=1 Tax=Deinococcus sp. KSM4-11 TaxID=2568654 RepID=UPI0010A3E8D5|nr:thioredoxin domain-containing protein [Deinococcus sp. KSM4-11]THF84879.1 DsbA family protein [Deinococcus sp. KSM4-11]